MRATRIVRVGDRPVTVKELTVGEVRAWVVDVEAGATIDPLHALALDECSLSDLARMSDIAAADLEAYAPSELADLVAACKALNPHFFRVRAALAATARTMMEEAAHSITPAAAS